MTLLSSQDPDQNQSGGLDYIYPDDKRRERKKEKPNPPRNLGYALVGLGAIYSSLLQPSPSLRSHPATPHAFRKKTKDKPKRDRNRESVKYFRRPVFPVFFLFLLTEFSSVVFFFLFVLALSSSPRTHTLTLFSS